MQRGFVRLRLYINPTDDSSGPETSIGIKPAADWKRHGSVSSLCNDAVSCAATAAGVPSTAIPFSADQAFWARQIHRLGVGPAAPPARRLTRGRLDAILNDALHNSAYERQAEILGENIRQEDGVAFAMRVIHAQLGAQKGQPSN